jgi:hypothetical protein
MEREAERKSSEAARSLSTIDAVRAIAAHNARAEVSNEKQLLLYLQSWWSRTYNRPLKDPLLLSYTIEELLYEFFDRIERKAAEEEIIKREEDRIEEDKEKAALDWAEEEERKELEGLKAEGVKTSVDAASDPKNVEWMKRKLEEAKQIYGEEFGEDVKLDFE